MVVHQHVNLIQVFSLQSQELCRHIFANQHKLRKLIQQQGIRLCSSTARLQETILDDDQFNSAQQKTIKQTIDSKLEPITHDVDNGRLFKVNKAHAYGY